jgi:hypothetical protein
MQLSLKITMASVTEILHNYSTVALQKVLKDSKSWTDFKDKCGLERNCDHLQVLDCVKNLDYKHLPTGMHLKSHIWSMPEQRFRDAIKTAKVWSEVMTNLGFSDLKHLLVAKERIKKLGMNVKHLLEAPRPDLEPLLTITAEELTAAINTPLKELKDQPPETWRELCTALGFPAKAKNLLKKRLKELGVEHSHIVQKRLPKANDAFKMNSKILRPVLITLLLERRPHKCEWCGTEEWRGKPVPLRMIRKGNDPRDNSEENLVLICANCRG